MPKSATHHLVEQWDRSRAQAVARLAELEPVKRESMVKGIKAMYDDGKLQVGED